MILVPLLNPKFANVPAEKSCELRVRGALTLLPTSFSLSPCGHVRAGHDRPTARSRVFPMADARQYETDVAIVGAGAAGIAAGIAARDAGARAIAFERDA